MSPDEMRVKIAEAVGWRFTPSKAWAGMVTIWNPDGNLVTNTSPEGLAGNLPAFDCDLNACHEMERTIYPNFETASDEELRTWMRYRRNLRDVTFADCQEGAGIDERLIRATALQRCEAFLRTKKLI